MLLNSADQVSNRYELVEKLGQGGMGVVYRAFDRLNRQTVALKKVGTPVEKLQFSASATSDNVRLALAVEFRTLASLRHPNIISVLDYGFDTDSRPYFTMELLPDAQPITQAAKDQPLEVQVRYLNELLLALAYLHRRGVIHRDLKPDNVLVTCSGQVKVLDFGLASGAALQSFTDFTEKLGGTLAYMAPELFSGMGATKQSDLYAVGMMAYEIFLRHYPFNTQYTALMFGDILTKVPDTSALLPDLAVLLNCLLLKAPSARPDNAERIMVDLCSATGQPLPPENHTIRESFLQASKFVGRERELDQLRDILHTAPDGHNAFVLIGGESGVGKSRLVDELRIRALVKGVTVLRGQGIADSSLPFQLWRDPARRLILSTPISDLEAGILKVVVPDISTILRREIADAPEVTGSAWQQRIVLTLAELFKRQKSPVLLILEDLQWAIESLAMLRHMLLMKERIPGLCIVGTYRNDERPDLPVELPGIQVLSLKPLDAAAIASLSESMLGEAGKLPQVVDLLQRETEGNAFFMVEVVRALAEDAGRLADIGRMMLPAHVFAGGVQQVIRRRLNGLPESVRNWLKMVAVAGRQLDLALIDMLTLTTQPDLLPDVPMRDESEPEQNFTLKLKYFIPALRDELLIQCANAAVLEVVDEVWRFRHDKLREALLAELSEEEIQWFNRQVAETIETLYPDDDSYDHILLEHWHQAEDVDKEIHYLNRVAGDLIGIKSAFEIAGTLLERGLMRLPDDDPRQVSLLQLQVRSYLQQGRDDQALLLTNKALDMARQVDDQYNIAYLLNYLGVLYRHQEDYALACEYLLQSVKLFQAINEPFGVGLSISSLGITALRQGDDDQAHEYFQRGLMIFQEIDNPVGIAYSLHYLGDVPLRRGDYGLAREYYHNSLAIRRVIGHQWGIALSLSSLAFVSVMAYDDQTQATFREALSYAYAIRAAPIILEIVLGFAWLALNQGQATFAAELAGLALHHPSGDRGVIRMRMDRLFPQLQTTLSPEELKGALERGKALNLDSVVAELLDEFSAE